MIRRFGFNINYEEAKLMVASVSKENKEEIGVGEFLNLIFGEVRLLKPLPDGGRMSPKHSKSSKFLLAFVSMKRSSC